MHLTRDGKFHRTDIWREGKWVDLWSVVHLLSGVSLGLGATLFTFGAVPTVIIVFILLVAYEMWEAMVKIHETPQNRFMDVVVGMVSFVPSFFFLQGLPKLYFIPAFGFVLGVNILLATIGWLASRKAEEFEKKLRAEFIAQRGRLRERRAKFRDAMKHRNAPKEDF